MPYADDLLKSVLNQVQVDDSTISEAKSRRTVVLDATAGFEGRLHTYRSGSLEYGTAITPPPNKVDKGVDGDGGVVLNRRVWSSLGPDSDDQDGPCETVEQVKDHIRPKLREKYPDVTVGQTTKRAILVRFGQPLGTGEDPPVELIVALTRKSGNGLWIPNLKDDDWDAADPETHRRLINDDPKQSLRRRRRHIMRLVKHWNKKHTSPAFSSFHLQALALEVITDDDIADALRTTLQHYFERAAESLANGDTPDPADVSAPFHLENGVSKEVAISRLEDAAAAIADANTSSDDQEAVYDAFGKVFHADTLADAEAARERTALEQGNASAAHDTAGRLIVVDRPAAAAATKNPSAWRRPD